MKKLLSVLIAAAMIAVIFCFPAFAEADERLQAMQGSFIELFPEFAKEEFHDYWIECISKYEAIGTDPQHLQQHTLYLYF